MVIVYYIKLFMNVDLHGTMPHLNVNIGPKKVKNPDHIILPWNSPYQRFQVPSDRPLLYEAPEKGFPP